MVVDLNPVSIFDCQYTNKSLKNTIFPLIFSALNKELQFVKGKQYSDLTSKGNFCKFLKYIVLFTYHFLIFISLWVVCGNFKKKEVVEDIAIDQEEIEGADEGLCSGVIISDRFALTAAHCLEEGEGR